jgi:hypothetical protein
MATIRPLQDRVLIKRVKEEEMSKGGIIIPDTAKEKPIEGEVIAVGNGKVLAFCSASTAAPRSRSTAKSALCSARTTSSASSSSDQDSSKELEKNGSQRNRLHRVRS